MSFTSGKCTQPSFYNIYQVQEDRAPSERPTSGGLAVLIDVDVLLLDGCGDVLWHCLRHVVGLCLRLRHIVGHGLGLCHVLGGVLDGEMAENYLND